MDESPALFPKKRSQLAPMQVVGKIPSVSKTHPIDYIQSLILPIATRISRNIS
jgi:hypothetical protein